MAPAKIDTIPYDIKTPVKNLKLKFELPLVTSAYTEIDSPASPLTPLTPYDIMTPVKNLKLELPLVTSAYTEIDSPASALTPYEENTVTTITPMVEVGYNTFKTKMEESVMPHLPEGTPEKFQSNMNSAVAHLTAAVEKVDTFACGSMDHHVGKVPALKEATPELITNTKEAATTYFNAATCFIASFSLAQVALKIVDTGLEVVEHGLKLAGTTDGNLVTSGIKTIHTTANTIRIEGDKAAGTEKAKKIEEATIVGYLMEVSGLVYIMGLLGLKLAKTEPEVVEVVDETETEVVDNK